MRDRLKPGQVYEKILLSGKREVLLRALSRDDLGACVTFANSLVRERAYNRDLGVLLDTRVSAKDEGKWLARVVKGIRSNDVISVGAFHGPRLVGNCDLHRERFKDLRHCGELGIAILEGYRGEGLGRRMLELLLEKSEEAGISLSQLRVLSINTRAINLYRSLGFREAGVVPGRVVRDGRRIDEILMFRQA